MIEIRPACMRDASYVIAHMRDCDRREIYCQLPDGISNWQVAYMLIMPESAMGFVAYHDGTPVALFGLTPITVCCLSVWAMGTDAMWRAIPAISDHIESMAEGLIERGFTTMEAKSIISHDEAHRWMVSCGARRMSAAFEYGKNGEHFLLFRWTVSDYRAIRQKRRRWNNTNKDSEHVFRSPKTTQATSSAAAA